MKDICRSIAMTFSMFSVVPMPMVEWKQENMKYMLCAFPLVGAVIGLALYVWYMFCQWLQIGSILFAAGLTLIPLAVSGGVHMDGYCDTVDALSSHAAQEKKREILKDSHAGAFAIIFTAAFFLLYFALCTEVGCRPVPVILLGLHQVLARGVSGFASVVLPSSGGNSILASFRNAAVKKAAVILTVGCAVCLAVMIRLSHLSGIISAGVALCSFLHIRYLAQKEFGGMSGDLAGFQNSVLQLILLAVYVFSERIATICF